MRVAVLALLAGCWTGNDAVTPPTTPPPAPVVARDDLVGTVWSGPDVDGTMTFRFRANGILDYTNSSGTWDNGRWSRQGNRVFVDMNQHYADYVGTIRGTTMAGTGSNVTGKTWTWSFRRTR